MKLKRGKKTVFSKITVLDSPVKQARGLMFEPQLKRGEAYFFPLRFPGTAAAAIHMLFVFFPIEAIWLDRQMRVVDKKTARPFGLYYAPKKPASFLVECGIGSGVRIGDKLVLEK